MFKCPICGNGSFSISIRTHNVFKCNGCSVIFENPTKFGKTNINTQPNEEQKKSFTLDDLDKVLAILKHIETHG